MKDPKSRAFPIRFSESQFEELTKAAEKSGLSIGAFSRAVLLGSPGPRAVRRPPVEKAMLAQLLGEIGKVGSNVNQTTRYCHTRGTAPVLAEIRIIRRDIAMMRTATLNALGMKP